MAKTTLLPALLLTGFCGAALAGTAVPFGAHRGAARAAAPAPAVLARGGDEVRPMSATRMPVAAGAALKGATLTQAMVGGVHANVVEMRMKSPLKEHERRKLQQMGFAPVIKDSATYYCRRERRTENGWVMDCFKPVS